MEMHAGSLIAKIVRQLDDNLFTNSGIDSWKRPLPVDSDDRPCLEAIGIAGDPADGPVV